MHSKRILLLILLVISIFGGIMFRYYIMLPHLDKYRVDYGIQTDVLECDILREPPTDRIIYRNRVWQVYQDGANEIFLYSAFYDDRDVLAPNKYIRILAVALKSTGKLYCQIWYPDTAQVVITHVQVTETGRGETLNTTSYGQYLYSCELPGDHGDHHPESVSITPYPCIVTSLLLPVQIPSKMTAHELGICVTISYGDVPAVELIEWFELNYILGVTEFNVYNGSLNQGLRGVFSYYERQGWLRLTQLPPIHEADYSVSAVQLNNDVSLNDCMYRNLYRHGHQVVIDFDEVISPHQHGSIPDMLHSINQTGLEQGKHLTQFTFYNTWFFKHMPQDEAQPAYLRTLRLRNRTASQTVAMKSITNPRFCLATFNHYCLHKLKDFQSQTVDPEIGFSHHYRVCNRGDDECKQLSAEATMDDTLMNYKEALVDRVTRVMGKLHITV